MTVVGTRSTAASPRARYSPTSTTRRAIVQAGVFLLILMALPLLLSSFWIQILTSVAIYSIVALSLAMLMGRVGLVSLCQIALLAVGGWIALRLEFATGMPLPLLILLTGAITAVIGTLIGLPALRLSGLYLALMTLMAAAAIT